MIFDFSPYGNRRNDAYFNGNSYLLVMINNHMEDMWG